MKKKKKLIMLVLVISLIGNMFSFPVLAQNNKHFYDVPKSHWAYPYVQSLRTRGITTGIGNNMFGAGQTISRYEFVTFLVRLMNWELVNPKNPTFTDATDTKAWYYKPLETAVAHNLLIAIGAEFDTEPDISKRAFGGNTPITRQEMAIMIVRALGYGPLAAKLDVESQFADVNRYVGYINVAKDLGIINGTDKDHFSPLKTAKREEAAAMMIRMADKLESKIENLHAFYAIRSFNQIDFFSNLNSVSLGWSRIGHNAKDGYHLNISSKDNNEFAVPAGYKQVLQAAKTNKLKTYLMVYANNTEKIGENGNLTDFFETISAQAKIIQQIVAFISDRGLNVDGVVIDFEEMKGQSQKGQLVSFLESLKIALKGKDLIVAVHPQRPNGQAYYDAYDFKKIGEIADKVILMAHDYQAKSLTEQEAKNGYTLTPLAPLDKIYHALRFITDPQTGVSDRSKIVLQMSFDTVQWKKQNDEVIHLKPYSPSYDQVVNALTRENTQINYNKLFASPYANFYDSNDQTNNIIWYEDSRSIAAKIQLAKMFDIHDISLWRLGTIPNNSQQKNRIYMDIWQTIIKQ